VEAVEKDMMEPNPIFKNLSQLFKEKEKEKFYSKDNKTTQKILRNISKKKGSLTKRSVEMLPI